MVARFVNRTLHPNIPGDLTARIALGDGAADGTYFLQRFGGNELRAYAATRLPQSN
jgi:hypothetical protein